MEILKKLSAAVLSLCMLAGAAVPVMASDKAEYPWVYECFEGSSLGKVTKKAATLTAEPDGTMKVKITSNITDGLGGYTIAVNMKKDQAYKLSFKLKLEEGGNIPRSGSKNNNYKADGTPAKLYPVIKGSSTTELDLGDADYWTDEEFVTLEKEFTWEQADANASLSFRVGEKKDYGGKALAGSSSFTYYLDDIMLIPVTETAVASSLDYEYMESETNTLKISYDLDGDENNSLAVLMTKSAEGAYKTNRILNVGDDEFTFQIPIELNGSDCKIVVYPADGTTAGKPIELEIENLRLNVIEELNIDSDDITANVTLCYPEEKQVIVMLCLYSAENEMIGIEFRSLKCEANTEVPLSLTAEIEPGTESAALRIWEGGDFKTSNMLSLVDEMTKTVE